MVSPAPTLLDDLAVVRGPIATVAPLAPIDAIYSYRIPPEIADRVRAGVRVSIRLGARARPQPAFCIEVTEGPWDSTLKPLDAVTDDQPLLSRHLIELGRWISRYYACPLGHTLHAMVPGGARRGAGRRRLRTVRRPAVSPSPVTSRRSARQAAALQLLAERGEMTVADLVKTAGCSAAVVRAMAAAGLVELSWRQEARPVATSAAPAVEPSFALNADQRQAVARILGAVERGLFRVLLLFGVTGSGKTECYVQAIRRVVAAGRQAIMLVPEIALTTQTAQRLSRRFERVAVIHSGLTDSQRANVWAATTAGQISVVIGTRSAVFAPCPNLGLIVVDEEPEPSYKNQAAPRYHTRDVAIKRGQIESIPVVLGSATPALETWHNVGTQKHFELLRLPHRVAGLPLPRVQVVDMRDEHRARPGVHLLSRAMEASLEAVLKRGEQAVLLLNRRGYASYIFCPSCNTPLSCPNCSVHLVFHTPLDLAVCHYCRERVVVPKRCPMAGCGGPLVRFGIGTQRVEEELTRKFPQARYARLDSDAMKRPEDYARVLGDFEGRKLDVLVGTQMVAKGLDFPFVSFVGVVSADTALGLPDFRAGERTFQLVLQVAGRSGRSDRGGHVVVQTFSRDLPVLKRAVRHDYEGFAADELKSRKKTGLPPFTRLVRLVLADARLSRLQSESVALDQRIADVLDKYGIRCDRSTPQPTPIPRLRNQYRYDLLLRFASGATTLKALDLLRAARALRARVQTLTVDVDPVSLQ